MGDGVLITIEGIDGCGKSTQAALLCEALVARGLPVGPAGAPGTVLREPGGTPAGEAVRDILLHGPDSLAPWTETMLYAAARAELVARVLRPGLAAGRVLVLDRYIDSSLAYQGYARGLGIDAVLAVNAPAVGDAMPALTVVLAVAPATGLGRATGVRDRIEREGIALQRRVADGFAELARRFPQRIRLVDGERPVAAVAADVTALVAPLVEGRGV
ncbi:MAG TPA: dTMP kinase [Thermoleophilia bacterium]|nr:dTMP kinase [Thermoleophilia bacterium]HQJ97684.1 dTMP kinase [Thermoleophilia bacterium]